MIVRRADLAAFIRFASRLAGRAPLPACSTSADRLRPRSRISM
jgi:hypothetical protein